MSDRRGIRAVQAHRHWMGALAVFGALYTVLYYGYMLIPDRLLIETVYHVGIVQPGVRLIGWLSPGTPVAAVANQIRSGGDTLEIVRGCDGSGVLFLLWAAVAATPVRRTWRMAGIAGALAVVYVLNQLRIIGLFYAFSGHRPWFVMLHSLVLPGLMIVAAGLYYLAWSQVAGHEPEAAA